MIMGAGYAKVPEVGAGYAKVPEVGAGYAKPGRRQSDGAQVVQVCG
jgi:hypothetical protein